MCMGLNHVKALELVLNSGKYLITGDTVFENIPDIFDTHEELESAFFHTSREVIDDGIDMIFEEKRYSPKELRTILADNWTGYEELRMEVINTFERFGQDAPEVDSVADRIAADFAAFEGRVTAFGGRFMPMIFGVTTGLLERKGPRTGSSPSGRLSGEIIAQSLQPGTAGLQSSPTEVLRSASVMDFTVFPGGISNVQNFDPSLVQGEAGVKLIRQLIRGYFRLGG